MHHNFIDFLSFKDGFLHRLDSKTKIISSLLLLILINLSNFENILRLLIIFVILTLVIIITGLPLLYLLKRSLIILPFVIFVAIVQLFKPGEIIYEKWIFKITKEGVNLAVISGIKAYLSIIVILLLVSTTRFVNILKGLESFKIPSLFLSILSFLYRYLFVLVDESMKIKMTLDSRAYSIPRIS